jgi:hypothetical protein
MAPRFIPLPTDLASAHALILAEHAARLEAEATVAEAQAAAAQTQASAAEAQATAARALAVNTSAEALIAHMKLEIEKLRRALHGHRSERKPPASRLIVRGSPQRGDRFPVGFIIVIAEFSEGAIQ